MWPFHCVHVMLSSTILLGCVFKYAGVADFLEHTSELEKAGAAVLLLSLVVGIRWLIKELIATYNL
jgi:hypothetical protein